MQCGSVIELSLRAISRAGPKLKKMADHKELPVYKAGYDLALEVFKLGKDLQKEYKYTVGERMKTDALELMTLVFRANTRRDRNEVLQLARERCENIRLCFRLLHDLRQLPLKKLVAVNEKIELVARQLAGWQKSGNQK